MGERDWLIPSLVLTGLSGAFALAMIPDRSGFIPALLILPLWLVAAIIIGLFYGFFAMAAAREPRPFARVGRLVRHDRGLILLLAVGIAVAGLNMITFMWIKPLLNYLVPFWADPLLADGDRLLFLGYDPWTLLGWLNSTPMAIFYHRGWFAMMILTLVVVISARPSAEKSALMLTYFMLWSAVGPLIHILLPAAGPIFYADMGYGDRFAGLYGAPETEQVADYLWAIYSTQGFGPGSGISAMPSMHIATTAWMIVAFHALGRRGVAAMAMAGLLIFLLSISLGWHYALDGVVGGAAALLCYRLLLAFYRSRPIPGFEAEASPRPSC